MPKGLKFPPKDTLESASEYCTRLNSLPAYKGQKFLVIQHKLYRELVRFAVVREVDWPYYQDEWELVN